MSPSPPPASRITFDLDKFQEDQAAQEMAGGLGSRWVQVLRGFVCGERNGERGGIDLGLVEGGPGMAWHGT